MTMVSLKNVSYSFEKEKFFIRNINLNIKEGEFVLISGRSGSGKSTIGRLINGLSLHYDVGKIRGRVEVDGQDISKCSLNEIGKVVGTVFQDPRSQFFTTTTDEEIAFGLQTICKTKEEIRERVEEVYKELNIEELKAKSVFELSSGEKQKIAIASIYAMKPKVFLLDEPSANLDMKAVFDLFRLLKKLKESGATVILIEHRLYYVSPIFTRFLLIKDGEITKDASRKEVLELPQDFFEKQGLRTLDLNYCFLNKERGGVYGGELIINGKNISFSRAERVVGRKRQKISILKDLDFKIEKGEAIGIIGLNGAGKTTFARILSGLDRIKEGEILDGKGKVLREKELMRQSYFVFQDSDYQLFSETVIDEMLIGLSGAEKEKNMEKVSSVLEILGLEKYKNHHPFALSRGEKQRLTVACGMMKEAKLFLYDEPTSGCDRDSMMAVSALIKRQIQAGISVFVISHDFEFLSNTVHSVWVLEDGKIKSRTEMVEENKELILKSMTGGGRFNEIKENRS